MSKYIVNHIIEDFENVEIDDVRLPNRNNTIVIILNNSVNTSLSTYYSKITDILLSGAKLITISTDVDESISKTIRMLMSNYKNYNMYDISDISIVNIDYLYSIIDREPDIAEVTQYLGGDIAAYGELNTMLFSITSLSSCGDIEGLKSYIENNIEVIQKSREMIECLKKTSDSINSKELEGLVANLTKDLTETKYENTKLSESIKEYKSINDKLENNSSELNKDSGKSKQRIKELEEQLANAGKSRIIHSYKELNTSYINCKVKYILYFKEISYSKYTNSLIMNMMNLLTASSKVNVKLLIYDNKVGIPALYKGISVLSYNEYESNKQKIIQNSQKYVISEPNQAFIEDILTYNNPAFDVLIVYDRLCQTNDIVNGNNVTKILVINSRHSYNGTKGYINIPDNALIISGGLLEDKSDKVKPIIPSMIIPEISEYNSFSDSAKSLKYFKGLNNNESITQTIFNRANINLKELGM